MFFLYTCSNIDELRTIRGGGPATPIAATIMGEDFPLDEDYSVYYWDFYSTLSDNPPEVVWPIDPDTGFPDTRAGRWFKVELGSVPQVNVDWNAVSGFTTILNKPNLSAIAISGNYSDLIGKPSLASVATSGSYTDLASKPTIPAAQINSDWNSSSGLSQVLNKPSLATVATTGSYNDLSSKPTIQAIQRTRVQTNSTGDYTWTFPAAYGTGVIPVISAVSESSSTTVPQGVQIVAISNTSVTIKVINLPSTSVLSIVVLGAPAGAQAYVHLTAVAP